MSWRTTGCAWTASGGCAGCGRFPAQPAIKEAASTKATVTLRRAMFLLTGDVDGRRFTPITYAACPQKDSTSQKKGGSAGAPTQKGRECRQSSRSGDRIKIKPVSK